MRFDRRWISFASGALLAGAYACPAGHGTAIVQAAPSAATASCGAGKDVVVQALERLRADSSHDQLMNADELLKTAIGLCSEFGDAWYYRSLVEDKLGHAAIARYALTKAQMFPSEAQAQGLNPFHLSTPPPSTSTPPPPIRQRWALVVGISSFADTSIKPLHYTSSDAEWFRTTLLDPKYGGFQADHVRLLTNDSATLVGIKEGLNWLARSAAPDDLVVVYIASHGSARELDTDGANYIITHDTRVGAKLDPDSLYATALPMVELSNAVATRLHSRRTAIFLDTCYSGGAAAPGKQLAPGVTTASVSKATLEHITQGSGRIIFAASRTDQESLESDDLQHGYFTYYLVQALRQTPGDDLTHVFGYVQQHVAAQVATDYKLYNLHQDPVMSRSSDEANFALAGVKPPTVTRLRRP